MSVSSRVHLKVADEVWIIVALLHREHPARPDFAVEEIMQRAKKEELNPEMRAGFYVHVIQHCVANRPPNPGRYRMLFESAPGRRRLFRPGDAYHAQREGAKTTPVREDVPPAYSDLLVWYRDWCAAAMTAAAKTDPLLSLLGSGKQLWAREPADEYVRRLRKGWE